MEHPARCRTQGAVMNSIVVVACLAGALGLASHPAAQSPAAPAFEVASVKPSAPDAPARLMRPVGGGRFIASSVTLKELVKQAYGFVFDFRIDGGPDWQTSRRFDIQAKAEDPGAGRDAMLPMLKALLGDRFQLKVHTEMREMPIFALVIARDGQLGANVTPSTTDCSAAAEQQRVETRAKAGQGAAELLSAGQGLPCAVLPVPGGVAGSMTWRGNGVSMPDLAAFLTTFTSRTADRMVQDRTGLSGLYDWEMTFDRAAVMPRALDAQQAGTSVPRSDSPPLVTAVQEQLGLKLEPAQGPVEILVIDSAALPTPD
jgi:uncharacterized protein (TIGR03435 family)